MVTLLLIELFLHYHYYSTHTLISVFCCSLIIRALHYPFTASLLLCGTYVFGYPYNHCLCLNEFNKNPQIPVRLRLFPRILNNFEEIHKTFRGNLGFLQNYQNIWGNSLKFTNKNFKLPHSLGKNVWTSLRSTQNFLCI